MIESHKNAKIIIVSKGEEEIIECEKIVIQWLTSKNKKVEIQIRVFLKDEKTTI